jgi:hypothetical protein
MASKRQQIVDAVKARFAQIRAENEYAPGQNYQTDIGVSQTEHHPTKKGKDELPAHDIRDQDEEPKVENRNAGRYERSLRIQIVAEIVETDATATNARKALEDMICAVGMDPTWGHLAFYTIPVDEDVMVDEDGGRIGAANITFDVIYSRAPWEP